MYWQRVTELAETGDASAQCLYWRGATEIAPRLPEPPGQAGLRAWRARHLERAAAQEHPQCLGDWGNYRYREDTERRAALNLQGAQRGCVVCQLRIAGFLVYGDGVPRDYAKAWCWLSEAKRRTGAVDVESRVRVLRGEIERHAGPVGSLPAFRAGTGCTVVAD